MRLLFLTWMCVFLIGFPSIGTAGEMEVSLDPEIAAKVGKETITRDEFRDSLIQKRKSGDMKKVLETLTPEGKERLLNNLVKENLYAMEAKKQKLDQDPEIARAVQNAVNAVLAESFLNRELSRLDLSESSAKKFYEDNPDLFAANTRIKARHIITKTREGAEAAQGELSGGREFAAVASERNIDSTRKSGGNLGWVVRGVMVKPFEEALFSLKESENSGIVKTHFGYHIARAEAIDKGKPVSFEEAREEVKAQMINQYLIQLRETLEKKYPVQLNRALLQEIK